MAECIHGFDEGLCDACSPRIAPEPPKPVKASRTAKPVTERRSPARSARVPGAPPARAGGKPAVPFAAQRIYHVTHVRNLEAILIDGDLRAGVIPELDVSSAQTRELRALAHVRPGVPVAEHVPFYVSPNATRWIELRDGAAGGVWSSAARESRPSDFVALVSTIGALGADVVVADGDAVSPVTRFATGVDEGRALIRRMLATDPDLVEPEVLAPGAVSFGAVALIGVSNDKVRALVKDLLFEIGGPAPRIAVYPPWFLPETG